MKIVGIGISPGCLRTSIGVSYNRHKGTASVPTGCPEGKDGKKEREPGTRYSPFFRMMYFNSTSATFQRRWVSPVKLYLLRIKSICSRSFFRSAAFRKTHKDPSFSPSRVSHWRVEATTRKRSTPFDT